MAISTIAVITSEPDGTVPRLKFFPTEATAYDHAQMICRDLNRDAYVVEVKHRLLACRHSWNAKNKQKTASTKCTTCGTPLDEIPFQDCPEHAEWTAKQPPITQQELIEGMQQELDEILQNRTGDD